MTRMPNCALAAIHIRQKNEREARDREIKAERERRAQEGESPFKVFTLNFDNLHFLKKKFFEPTNKLQIITITKDKLRLSCAKLSISWSWPSFGLAL